ncbi:unnamed protein product [Timema podura]|uniref:ATP-dependent RNA helicase DDX60 n=1 Tax=Timema podura TaxID=61482 RepID=A0ABN7P0F8_TIMPD|nr:unnamed protein product [Timema podura]
MHRQAPGTSSDYKETSPDENEENRFDSSDSEDVGESGDESGLSENREANEGGVEIESYEEEQKKEQEAMDELEDEYRKVKSNISPPQLLNLLSKAMDKLVTLTYADISNSVSNGTPFLVDGDMLLVHAMADENWSSHFGGQMLHLIYLCERIMQIFVQKGGTFQIVFFKSWYDAWDGRHDLLLARTVLLLHFKHNSPYEVYEFDTVWDPLFKHHLAKFRPAFILVDLHIDHYPGDPLVKLTYYTEILFATSTSLMCVDLNELTLAVSTLHAFFVMPNPVLKGILSKFSGDIVTVLNTTANKPLQNVHIGSPNIHIENTATYLHMFVTVYAAYSYFSNEKNVSYDYMKIFLLYSVIIQRLPLKYRGSVPPQEPRPDLEEFISKVQGYMTLALQQVNSEDCDMSQVADIWHGNLFAYILYLLSSRDTDEQSDIWRDDTRLSYERLVTQIGDLSGRQLKPFPVHWEAVVCPGPLEKDPECLSLNREDVFNLKPLLPINCNLIESFSGDLMSNSVLMLSEEAAILEGFITRNSEFDEIRHYHSRRALTDDLQRTKETISLIKSKDPFLIKKQQRLQSKYIRFLNVYGMNMEGKLSIPKSIICTEQISKQKLTGKKQKKQSKNALKYIQQNELKNQAKYEEIDNIHLEVFLKNYKVLKSKHNYELALKEVEILLKKLNGKHSRQKAFIKKAEICYKLGRDKRELVYVKQLFLTVKHLLQSCIETALSESDKKHIASWLRDLGFEEMVERCKLPLPPKNTLNPGFYVGPSHVRFQMAHLGPELDRNTGGVPDVRVTGFTPDTWQRDLFDVVDKKQSALVVAPTSSGKTYASYYCMEQVLRESNDGIVVYVSPTKALVNQVHATLYARFKNKSMPAGMSAVGVFTREYRHKALECQILVTVPQCLELLLLSPRQHSWVSRLRYVILDEIHCLAGQSGGISWERLPSLDSMPIHCSFCHSGNSRSTGSYHVELVEYYNRHSDLTKYVYSGGKLKHVHPYAFVDDTVIKQNNGIPSHVSLSPSETLELYDIMRSVSEDDQTLDALNPDTFFNSSIFLIRDSVKEKETKTVRKYEAKLRTLLEIWSQEQPQKFSKVHRQLNCGVNVPSENDSREALFSQCVGLIKTLHQQDMLPALIFSYDRSFVEKMFIKITEFCEEGDIKVEKEKLTKFEKRMEKKKLEELENIPKDFHRNSLGLLDGQSGFRSIGVVDKDDIKLIESRLISENYTSTSPLVRGFRQGLGLHHGGRSAKVKSSVEMMFRLRILNVVIATGTLALGIHMPCRTVVLAGDSPYINALEFHQMSGRAGRRGFDKEGHVVFMGLGRRKVQTLLTDKFPVMVGNFPLSVGTVLRLLLLVSRITSHGEQNEATTRDALSR